MTVISRLENYFSTVLHPERYHGHYQQPPFFEGWYYKLIDASTEHRYAVIPGISLSREDTHSFVQVLNGVSGATTYHRYPREDFWAAQDAFEVRIGPNRFTSDDLQLDLPEGGADEAGLTLKGEVHFNGTRPWPVTVFSPGIMGWYGWIPGMECYHGVVSLDHALHGTLRAQGQPLSFDGGRGYIEKDWGRAFPSSWVWLQSNHFSQPGVSLTASIAMIPVQKPLSLFKKSFRGFIVGLLIENQLYRFATYTGAETEALEIEAAGETTVTWTLRDEQYRLHIRARHATAGDLLGPSTRAMDRRVPETLDATVEVRLSTREGARTLFAGTGYCGGMEVGGNIPELLGT